MKFALLLTFSAVLVLGSQKSYAQSSLEGFSTGRYEIRKTAKSSRRPASVTEDESVASPDDMKVKMKEEPAKAVGAFPTAVNNQITSAAPTPAPVPVAPVVKPVPAAAEVAEETEEPGISEQAQSLFSNQAGKIYEFYREQVHPDDIRNNRMEIEFAPMVIYNDSQSNYSFRDYQSYLNAVKLKANVWFTPLIGVSGKFMFSMGGDIDAMDSNHSRVSAKYEFTDVGLNFRKFFGVSRKSNSLEFSLLYSDEKFKVPSEATNRINIKSTGIGLGLKARFPTSITYAWVFGGSFFPRLQHHESEAGAAITSGALEENTRMSLDFGGEWKFSRESQLLWGLEASTERNLFDGAASTPDPSTGTTPSNVSVTNSFYMFTLGYRWGH